MKGVKLIIFVGLTTLFLTGCGNNSDAKTLTCTNTTESDGIESKEDIIMTFDEDEDKISNIKLSIDSKVTAESAKENWEFFVAMMESQFIETEEDGFTLTTDNDTDNYTFNITLDIDPTLAREDIFSTYGLASLGDYNSTYNEVKEAGVEAGFTCE